MIQDAEKAAVEAGRFTVNALPAVHREALCAMKLLRESEHLIGYIEALQNEHLISSDQGDEICAWYEFG